jgi:uncharacterized protein
VAELNDTGFYPYQEPIDAYGNGGFRFAELSHRGSLLCLPTGMHAWAVGSAAEITMENLAPVFAAADSIDVLMIGLGSEMVPFPRDLREALRAQGIIVEAISTSSAVSTYNILLGERRAVAAALVAVDRVR